MLNTGHIMPLLFNTLWKRVYKNYLSYRYLDRFQYVQPFGTHCQGMPIRNVFILPYLCFLFSTYCPVLRHLIQHFNWIRMDPVPEFWYPVTKIEEKNTYEIFFLFWSKIATGIYLSLGLHKGRPRYRRSLQPSKENIQHLNHQFLHATKHFKMIKRDTDQTGEIRA